MALFQFGSFERTDFVFKIRLFSGSNDDVGVFSSVAPVKAHTNGAENVIYGFN